MYHFCTYFDRHFLPRGLALHNSLRKHCPAFTLWVLCLDAESHRLLTELALADVRAISLDELERGDHALLEAKKSRSRIEYYFTCTPSLALYVMEKSPEIELITYLDADLFFFADPLPLFNEMGNRSVAIIAHRFSPKLKDRARFGIYNVGWVSFRRDKSGLACLRWWRDRCIEWCFDREEDGRYGDQKYLDDWPSRYSNVAVLEHKGANLAPWNVDNYELGISKSGQTTVDGQPLIFFHFHALTRDARWVYDPGWVEYGVRPSSVLLKRIYIPYLRSLLATNRELLGARGSHPITNSARVWKPAAGSAASPLRTLVRQARHLNSLRRDVVAGRKIFLGPR